MAIIALRTGAPVSASPLPSQTNLSLPDIASHGFTHTLRGEPGAPIVVLCDPPKPGAIKEGLPMGMDALTLCARSAREHGFTRDDMIFMALCPPLPENALNSASRKWAHVEKFATSALERIKALNPRCVVTLGDLATRVMTGRSVAITKARGTPIEGRDGIKLFPMLSPAFVNRIPEHLPAFQSDFGGLRRFVNAGYVIVEEGAGEYEWREDISDILEDRPEIIGLDTEGTGLVWRDPRVRVLTVQISTAPGNGFVCPVDEEFWPEWAGRGRARARLVQQIKRLLEDPEVKKVGHNLKFDQHMLRKSPLNINLQGWEDDTQLLAFAVDENMMRKGQEECLARWVPELAAVKGSLTDADLSNMLHVPRDKFLPYAGSDPDGVLRLRDVLLPMVQADRHQYNVYKRILMPGIRAFGDVVERYGIGINQERLRSFGSEVEDWAAQEYRELIQMVPPAVRRKHLEAGRVAKVKNPQEMLKFSRPAFVRDILFTPEGFGLKPLVYTKGTMDLEEDEREASTSSKGHLPYFTDRDDAAGEFCRRLVVFQQSQKLASTYIGNEEEDSGLWQYIAPNGRIYPSYLLHATVTGRTASRDPNGQNFPKRGKWAKSYQSIFVPTPGFKLVNCDLSQIELRIAAWMARDTAMLRVYQTGGDIHTTTAIAANGLTPAQWAALPQAERKLLRTKAKAINFGFLYGMGAAGFRRYAKLEYGVNYTERESFETRARFFATYRHLEGWHARMREEARNHGYVRALHGARRNLPSIYSNDPGIRSGAERQAINSPVQRFGSDLGVMAMARFSACADPDLFRIIGFVHDALMMEVREGYEREGVESLIWAMQSNPLEEWFGITPPCPIIAEGDIGINGQDMLELAELPPVDKQPEWFRSLNLPMVERDGKLMADINPRRPDWWNDEVDSADAFERVLIRQH